MASGAAADSSVYPQWGESIPVESIQELALNMDPQLAVSPRYIRPPEERPTSLLLVSPESAIPLIDMKKLVLHPEDSQRQQEMQRLSNACQEWGFFQIVNHGIPHSLLDGIKVVAKEFFNLPLQEKKKYAPQAGVGQGYGKSRAMVAEDRTLDWGDLFILALMPNNLKNLAFWPTVPTNFRDTVERYAIEVEKVAQELLSLFAENLHLEADYFKDKFGSEPLNIMRMNLYPPCPRPDLVLGLSPHSDGAGITLLLQDDQTEGLHIRKNDQWIPVQPIPYALVVNIGDLVEIMTNGRYKSVEHRAVTNQERARLSVALFYSASMDVEVAPSSKLVDEDHKVFYRKFIHEEYFRYYLSRQVKGKHRLDFAKLDIGNN